MKLHLRSLLILALIPSLLLGSCSKDHGDTPCLAAAPKAEKPYLKTLPINRRHKDTPLKILAIGNSFTSCATSYLPLLIKHFEGDSVCFARLVHSGATLSMHWTSHVKDLPDYELYYSDGGNYVRSEICTFDDAIDVLPWDIIVVQQMSGLAGDYTTYQPALDYLVNLFRHTYPHVLVAWQYTWAYMPGTVHEEFYRYGYDSERMYRAILSAGDRACADAGIDIPIRSAKLVHRLRQEFPQATDGFASDGYHIDAEGLAGYALSALWFESLIGSMTGISCLDSRLYPEMDAVERNDIDRALDIVGCIHL